MRYTNNTIKPGMLIRVPTWTTSPVGSISSRLKCTLVFVVAGPFKIDRDQIIGKFVKEDAHLYQARWLMITPIGNMYWENDAFLRDDDLAMVICDV